MRKDLTGMRFGRLTAVEPTDKRTKDGNVIWRLACDCGNTCEAPTSELLRGRVQSCGCARHEPRGRNLAGRRFGMLEVVGRSGTSQEGQALWKCRCDCGREVVVSTRSLAAGKSSCGCASSRRRDLAGQRFGRLTAVRPVGRRSGYVVWECRCDCGNYKDVTSQLLTTGRTRSCGCLRGERGAEGARAASSRIVSDAAGGAVNDAGLPASAKEPDALRAHAAMVRPGNRFGDLIVVDEAAERRAGVPAWRCVSDAGEVVYRTAAELAATGGATGEGAA